MTYTDQQILGIDIGGTGIKMAIVDALSGKLMTERFKELTPRPATPDAIIDKILEMKERYFPQYNGPLGCGFPGVVKKGRTLTAANVHKDWINVKLDKLLGQRIGMPVFVANDADLAGLAEFTYGSGKSIDEGLVIFLTIGTGIGSAFFFNQKMIPNTELGHLLYRGESYEKYAANSAREREDLSWKEWGKRFNGFLNHVSFLFSPDAYIIGGGVSKKMEKYKKHLDDKVPISAAELMNAAGVIGAAIYAYEMHTGTEVIDAL